MHTTSSSKAESIVPSKRWQKIHRYSGITLSIFFFFHTINHLFAWGGPDTHIKVMNIFRIVYRFPPVEAVILLSALMQVISGPLLVWKKSIKDVYSILQIVSGLYLAFFLFYHIRAIMLGRYVWNVETDFHFAAWGVKNSPADRFFIPYYSLSIICVFIHVACVHREKMLSMRYTSTSLSHVNRSIQRQTYAIMVTGLVVASLIIVSFIRA